MSLRDYVQHKSWCIAHPDVKVSNGLGVKLPTCTCGLDALLAQSETPQPEKAITMLNEWIAEDAQLPPEPAAPAAVAAPRSAEAWQPIATYSDDGEVVVWNGQPYRAYYQDPDGWFADVDGELLRIGPPPTHWIHSPEPWKDAKMEEFCLGCNRPTALDCGCPAGTGWRKEATTQAPAAVAVPPPAIVNGYDAQFWHDSYNLLRDAVVTHLDSCIQDDDVAEEAILVEAIERAGQRLAATPAAPGELGRAKRAEMIAGRIAASTSGKELRRNIAESLLIFPEITPTVRILAAPEGEDR